MFLDDLVKIAWIWNISKLLNTYIEYANGYIKNNNQWKYGLKNNLNDLPKFKWRTQNNCFVVVLLNCLKYKGDTRLTRTK